MHQVSKEIKFDGCKMQESDVPKINNEDFLKQKEILESQHQQMGGSNVPVYGHLVTADQLNQIEQRKGAFSFHHTDNATKCIGPSCDTTSDTHSDNLIYANVINEPMEDSYPSTIGPLESHLSSPSHIAHPNHAYTLPCYANTKFGVNSDKSTDAPYYHYPDLSNCQSTLDKDRLYVNTFSSNAQHNFTRVNNTTYSKGAPNKHHSHSSQGNNAKSDFSLERIQPLLPMETESSKYTHKCPNNHIIAKMSVDLIKTYKNINEIYYRKKRRIKEPSDDTFLKRDRKRNSGDSSDCKSTQNLLTYDGAPQNKGSDVPNENMKKSGPITEVNANAKFATPQNYVVAGNVLQANVNSSSNKDLAAYEYLVKSGEIWKSQFCIEKLIGTGSFGQVVRAKDLKSGEYVAIKIIKNKRHFVEQAYIEIDLLKEIGKYQESDEMAQETGANYIVKLKSHFNHRGHLCLVFELLTYTLYDLLKNTNFRGVSLNLTRKFAQQICQALVFLSRPQVQIIHCDLKPENILLLHPRRSAIKVVDFGSSCHANRRIYYYIQSRFYRSPEIILNLEYSHAIDMWSLGCIMAELHSGQPLFIGQFEHEQILRIIEIIGMPPNPMIDSGKKSLRYFERFPSTCQQTKFVYKPKLNRDRDGKKISFQGVCSRALSDILGVYTGGPQGRRLNEPGHAAADYEKFLDLLQKMLIIDPSKRIKPDEALNHPFFVKSLANSDVNSNFLNTGSKSTTITAVSTSCDKTMISTAAASKGNITDKCPGNKSQCIQSCQSQMVSSACDSNLPDLSQPEATYLSLTTITTTAN